MEWNVGLQNYKKCSLELHENCNHFTTELLDVDFERGRDIADIFYDHLANRQTKYVEVLYSGGLDSELVLMSCLRKNIPVKAITLLIRINGMIINTHDLYYAEKFCREQDVPHTILELDAVEFFQSGKFYDYLTPYYISEPHIATHMWLIEQCSHFPIIGGDWPWVQTNKVDKILSPFKLEFSSYERFMQDKGIYGIGNMISHSLESSYKIMELHIQHHEGFTGNENLAQLKQRMFSKLEPMIEPRIKSFGWENNKQQNFHLHLFRLELFKKVRLTTHRIKWGATIAELLGTTIKENDTFK